MICLMTVLYSRGTFLCEVRALIQERFLITETDCAPCMAETEAKERDEVDF